MNPHIEELKHHLDQCPVRYGYDGIDSLLELLGCIYMENNPVENTVIQHKFTKMDRILSRLTLKENNAVFELVCQLCTEYAKRAFAEGLHVGFRLWTELSDI